MSRTVSSDNSKKRYEKPRLRVVNIADSVQTLGIGCKTTSNTTSQPGSIPCAPVSGTPCFQPGS